jgi:hydroxymethylbilane synthase
VIAIQAREGSPAAAEALQADHASTHAALDAERHVVRALEATCHTPVGVLAAGGVVRGFVGLPDGSEWLVEEASSGEALAAALLRAGATEMLRALTP